MTCQSLSFVEPADAAAAAGSSFAAGRGARHTDTPHRQGGRAPEKGQSFAHGVRLRQWTRTASARAQVRSEGPGLLLGRRFGQETVPRRLVLVLVLVLLLVLVLVLLLLSLSLLLLLSL